jgi:hypothetical protein
VVIPEAELLEKILPVIVTVLEELQMPPPFP